MRVFWSTSAIRMLARSASTQLSGPVPSYDRRDHAARAGYVEHPPRRRVVLRPSARAAGSRQERFLRQGNIVPRPASTRAGMPLAMSAPWQFLALRRRSHDPAQPGVHPAVRRRRPAWRTTRQRHPAARVRVASSTEEVMKITGMAQQRARSRC